MRADNEHTKIARTATQEVSITCVYEHAHVHREEKSDYSHENVEHRRRWYSSSSKMMTTYLGDLVLVLCKKSLELVQVNFAIALGIEAMEDTFEVLSLALAGVPFLFTRERSVRK